MLSLKSLTVFSCLSVMFTFSSAIYASPNGSAPASVLSTMSAQDKSKRAGEIKKYIEETAKLRKAHMDKQVLANAESSKKMNEMVLKQQEEMDKLVYESLTTENFDQNKMQTRSKQMELEMNKMQKEFEAKNKASEEAFSKVMMERNSALYTKWNLYPTPTTPAAQQSQQQQAPKK